MRLTARDVMEAVIEVAIATEPGEELGWDAVADRLNARLEANLVGRAPASLAGKHQRVTVQ